MTDPQIPATEAGRRLLAYFARLPAAEYAEAFSIVGAIEAEARADYAKEAGPGHAFLLETAVEAAYERARADALREAAERVRALDAPKRYENDANGNWFTTDMEYGWDCGTAAVLAILDPEAS